MRLLSQLTCQFGGAPKSNSGIGNAERPQALHSFVHLLGHETAVGLLDAIQQALVSRPQSFTLHTTLESVVLNELDPLRYTRTFQEQEPSG